MKLGINWCRQALILAGVLFTGSVWACDHDFDGCLGCNDDQLPICLKAFVAEICKTSGNPTNCDTERAYDDAERYVMISTGSHMSKVRSMVRSSRKYQFH